MLASKKGSDLDQGEIDFSVDNNEDLLCIGK